MCLAGGCERIYRTPIPVSYTSHSARAPAAAAAPSPVPRAVRCSAAADRLAPHVGIACECGAPPLLSSPAAARFLMVWAAVVPIGAPSSARTRQNGPLPHPAPATTPPPAAAQQLSAAAPPHPSSAPRTQPPFTRSLPAPLPTPYPQPSGGSSPGLRSPSLRSARSSSSRSRRSGCSSRNPSGTGGGVRTGVEHHAFDRGRVRRDRMAWLSSGASGDECGRRK